MDVVGAGGQGARHEPLCAGAFGTPRQRGGKETAAQGRNRRWGASTTWPYAGRPGPLLAAGAHVAVRRRAAPRLLARVASVAHSALHLFTADVEQRRASRPNWSEDVAFTAWAFCEGTLGTPAS